MKGIPMGAMLGMGKMPPRKLSHAASSPMLGGSEGPSTRHGRLTPKDDRRGAAAAWADRDVNESEGL